MNGDETQPGEEVRPRIKGYEGLMDMREGDRGDQRR